MDFVPATALRPRTSPRCPRAGPDSRGPPHHPVFDVNAVADACKFTFPRHGERNRTAAGSAERGDAHPPRNPEHYRRPPSPGLPLQRLDLIRVRQTQRRRDSRERPPSLAGAPVPVRRRTTGRSWADLRGTLALTGTQSDGHPSRSRLGSPADEASSYETNGLPGMSRWGSCRWRRTTTNRRGPFTHKLESAAVTHEPCPITTNQADAVRTADLNRSRPAGSARC